MNNIKKILICSLFSMNIKTMMTNISKETSANTSQPNAKNSNTSQETIGKLQERINILQTVNQCNEDEIESLKITLRGAEKDITQAQLEVKEAWEKQVKELNNEFEQLTAEHENLMNKYNKLMNKYDELMNKYDELMNKYDELKKKKLIKK